MSIYCHLPAEWGLQQTTRDPGSDKTRGQGSFGPFTGGLSLRQGEPGTSHYCHVPDGQGLHQTTRPILTKAG